MKRTDCKIFFNEEEREVSHILYDDTLYYVMYYIVENATHTTCVIDDLENVNRHYTEYETRFDRAAVDCKTKKVEFYSTETGEIAEAEIINL